MKRTLGLMILIALLAPLLATPARAADVATSSVSVYRSKMSTFPLSRAARDIRRADFCWRGCLADAGRAFQACLRVAPPSECVPRNDAADRYCLRQCRLSAGSRVQLAE